jgi:hypothetical protein
VVLESTSLIEHGDKKAGGPWGTVPELLFEKKGLIPEIQNILA